MKYKLTNGWTKESVMAQVKKYNDGTRAAEERGGTVYCQYLSPTGNRCAIGSFIPDGHVAFTTAGDVEDLLCKHKDLCNVLPFDNMPALLDREVE